MKTDHKRLYIILVTVVVLVVAVAAVMRLGPQASPAAQAARNTVVAQGSAVVSVKPDMATLSVGATAQDASAKEAQSQVNKIALAMIEAARAAGLADEDILTSGISLYPTYDYTDRTNQINGYQAQYTLTLKVRDMDNVGSILDSQIDAGANSNGSVSFGLEDDSEHYKQALENAVADAKETAETLAAASGVKLGVVITLNEGSSGYSPVNRGDMMMSAAADAAGTPIMAETVNINAAVTVTYELR